MQENVCLHQTRLLKLMIYTKADSFWMILYTIEGFIL